MVTVMDESTFLQLFQQEGSEDGIPDSFLFAAAHAADHQALIGLLNSLAADGLLELTSRASTFLELTEEGKKVLADGSPEAKVFAAISPTGEGTTQEALLKALGKDCVKIGMGPLMKAKAVRKEGDKLVRAVPEFQDGTQAVLRQLTGQEGKEGQAQGLSEEVVKTLRKRQLVTQVKASMGTI
ncbi:phenylalanyl-trna synthetase alpha chain [Nannochloropsis gaditana CCMP526]|uniref:phenylalanyl-trna synthetase alpha chain n=1 Tax=Nannochloropsis gaditana (strain CCMP526) TaxID=1093141 RepID=UPI00029F7D04|nr:phenylalanyl-trna synthetase alpha chain [Nannochloropsis gaditana CCMP526]EKU22096.1 phenylalanyl-trna synthetase alpha chain [Nannochloropsis gaditana CCMP526]|eukprot:XP_005854261.1 phenylalanyl-trna synthetase alpha chain [Nannochloropsis gaditana CCMP526]